MDFLANLRWKARLFILVFVPLCSCIVMTGIATYALLSESRRTEVALSEAMQREEAANQTQLAILTMRYALQALISADSQEAIREYAIHAIKANSVMDETITNLRTILPGDAKVEELEASLANTRLSRLKLIKYGKQNQDDKARNEAERIDNDVVRIVELSQSILANERDQLKTLAEASVEKNESMALRIALSLIVTTALALGVAAVISRSMMYSLKFMRNDIRSLAAGELVLQEKQIGNDEIGETTRFLGDAVYKLEEVIRGILGESGRLRSSTDTINHSVEEISQLSHQVAGHVTSIKGTFGDLDGISNEVSEQIEDCARESGLAAENSAQAHSNIEATLGKILECEEQMNLANEKLAELSKSAQTITGITATIRAVSEQTNLLALNAAIEAARAGEQGRGFAVVADEVRTLAMRSGEAVEEITKLADDMRTNVTATSDVFETSHSIFEANVNELQHTVETVAAAMESAGNSLELLRRLQQFNNNQQEIISNVVVSMEDLSTIANTTDMNTEELKSLSSVLRDISEQLNAIASYFKLEG